MMKMSLVLRANWPERHLTRDGGIVKGTASLSASSGSTRMHPVETEVKFHIRDPADLRARLLTIGARSLGRVLERNIRFEDEAQNLLRNKSLLRLRQDRKTTLTHKSVPADADPTFKQFLELEVEVDDFDVMQRILMSLGFHPEQTYEKWRETLVQDQTHFCLDTLPFGEFLEIEGSKEAITHFSACLGLDWNRRILMSYLEIFDLIRVRYQLPFRDVTFGNFATTTVYLDGLLPKLESGPHQPPEGFRSTA
jgi:adenylate cyclase class 2